MFIILLSATWAPSFLFVSFLSFHFIPFYFISFLFISFVLGRKAFGFSISGWELLSGFAFFVLWAVQLQPIETSFRVLGVVLIVSTLWKCQLFASVSVFSGVCEDLGERWKFNCATQHRLTFGFSLILLFCFAYSFDVDCNFKVRQKERSKVCNIFVDQTPSKI